jgi:predicted AAA+ superfamily ATPase
MRYFREYVIVGGMPSVVSAFIKTSNISEVLREQKDIINSLPRRRKKYSEEKIKSARSV